VDSEPLDNCFTGWNGVAAIPGLRIEADAVFRELQVFTPAGANFFCVEPVSHVPDAINRAELTVEQSMAVLAPGQSMRGGVTFAVTGAQTGARTFALTGALTGGTAENDAVT
jgi:aldose 1-epimerase